MLTPKTETPLSPQIVRVEDLTRLFLALAFLAAVYVFVTATGIADIPSTSGRVFLIISAVVGAYMALNIGANDVANNIGPAVGSGALTLTAAIALAFIFESSGALIAGGDVVKTIKKGIICLLYTSPSPRDRQKSRMPSSA